VRHRDRRRLIDNASRVEVLAVGRDVIAPHGGAALYKTKAGWKIVELTSDRPLESMIDRPKRRQ